jgi:hypothetical protein
MGNFGLARTSALARELAAACRTADTEAARKLLAEIIAAAEPAVSAIRARFGRAA